MRYIVFVLLFTVVGVACTSGEKPAGAASDVQSVPTVPPAGAASADYDFPNPLPEVDLAGFQRNRDGSGLAGIPRPMKIEKPPKGLYFTYEYFRAHVLPRQGGPGEDINVYQPAGGLAYIGGGEATYYSGIYNQFLLLDVGTGAAQREIMAVNMVTGDTTHRAAYYGDYALMRGNYLIYLSQDPSGEDCTAKGNLQGKMHRTIWVNLDTGRSKESTQRVCLYVE